MSSRRATVVLRCVGALVATVSLTGCPATWGFGGVVGAAPADRASGPLTPVPGVTVTCDGCSDPVVLDAHGEFGVGLGSSYGDPAPVVLHFQAPGYEPVTVDVKKGPMIGQAGPTTVVVVMQPNAAPAP